MLKKSATMMILCLLMTVFFTVIYSNNPSAASGNKWYVDDDAFAGDGSAEFPFRSIQEAIDIAESGDTIYVYGGVYNETLIIDKSISLIGSIEEGNSVIERNYKFTYCVKITGENVNLKGFNITDENSKIYPYGSLIYVSGDNAILQKNNLSHCQNGWGIYINSANSNLLKDNKINDTKLGLYINAASINDIYNNTFYNCENEGVKLYGSNLVRLSNNNISNNKYGVYASKCNNFNFTLNNVSNNQRYGIAVYDGAGGIIRGNIVKENDVGGLCLSSDDVNVSNNKFVCNQIGIRLVKNNCEISNNFINNSLYYGINAESYSTGNVIFFNHFFRNDENARDIGDNQWYNSGFGNYWDDYKELDIDPKDGIGDTVYSVNGVLDKYPLGVFLKPPDKPAEPSYPADGLDNVGLEIELRVNVTDPDGEMMTVYFYRVHNVTSNITEPVLVGKDTYVENDTTASCRFRSAFHTPIAWYVNISDGKLTNQSDIWFFYTRETPGNNTKPVPIINAPTVGQVGIAVTFNASASYDPDGNIEFYHWNFYDESSEILSIAPKHVFQDSGDCYVTLTVIDNKGAINVTKSKITITQGETAPNVDAGGPYSGNIGDIIKFNSSASYDVDGTIVEYVWDFGDETTSTEKNPTHMYSNAGTYTVTLYATDNDDNTDSDMTTVTIKSTSSDKGIPGFELILLLAAVISIYFHNKFKIDK